MSSVDVRRLADSLSETLKVLPLGRNYRYRSFSETGTQRAGQSGNFSPQNGKGKIQRIQ